MYTFPISEQLTVFMLSLGAGFVLGLLYDAVRIVRLIVPGGKATVIVFDMLFFALSAFLSFLFILAVNKGYVRAYILLGEALGFVLFMLTFGAAVLRAGSAAVNFVKKMLLRFARRVCRIAAWVLRPFLTFGRKIGEISKKNVKKTKKTFKKLLLFPKKMLYNLLGVFRKRTTDSESVE